MSNIDERKSKIMNNNVSHRLANMLKCLELILNEKRDEMSVIEINDILNKINDIYNIEATMFSENSLKLPILYMKNKNK